MEVEKVLSHLGTWGRWQLFSYNILAMAWGIPTAWHMLSIVFTGGQPDDFHCKLNENQTFNESIPIEWNKKEERYRPSQCKMFKYPGSSDNSTIDCPNGYKYITDYTSTIVMEFDLVCDKGYQAELSQTLFVVGVMVGATVFTTLSDRFGRKPVHLGCQWVMIVVGVACAFVQDYYTFVAFRFFMGCLQQGIIMACFVQSCEIFPADGRTFAGIFLEVYWAIAMMMLALFAYFIRNWRHLEILISLPALLTIAGYWFFPESIPWLVANKRSAEAKVIVRHAAKMNKIDMPESLLNTLDGSYERRKSTAAELKLLKKRESIKRTPVQTPTEEKVIAEPEEKKFLCFKRKAKPPAEKRETIFTILKHPRLRIYAIIMCFLWFTASLVYYGLSLSTSSLAGSRYLNFFLSGAVEVPAYVLAIFVLQRFGRRIPLVLYYTLAGVCLFVTPFVPKKVGEASLAPLIITLTMIGKFGITACFAIVFLYAGEIYPTNIRNVGIGLASVAARIGGMIAPFSSYVVKTLPWLPGVVFGALSIAVGLMTLYLPETLGKPLPQTVHDMEDWLKSEPKKDQPAPPSDPGQEHPV